MELLALALELLSLLQVGSLLQLTNCEINWFTPFTVAVHSTLNGTLVLTNQPFENEPTAYIFGIPLPNDNRTGIAPDGDTPTGEASTDPLLTCTAGHHGDELINYPPLHLWCG